MTSLRPFWRYYGGKWRAAPRYPAPTHSTIIEPFAGAAGYSMRYADREVVLVEKYTTIAEMWRWLIGVRPAEVLRIPEVESVDDLPSWVSAGARSLVGFAMNSAATAPRRTLSAGRRKLRALHRQYEGRSPMMRERVASQVDSIKHWRIIEGDWSLMPTDEPATYFVDPPYNNRVGTHYVHGPDRIDFSALATACHSLPGQVIVCENEGADWLPFEPFGVFKPGPNNTTGGSREVMWTRAAKRAMGT